MFLNCPRCGTTLEIYTDNPFIGTPWTVALCTNCFFEVGSPEPSGLEELIASWQTIQN